MSEHTKIAWADSSWNPWIGCSHAGPGCDHCYAEAQNKLRKWNGGSWGNTAPRQVTSEKNWGYPVSWNHKALAGRCGKDGKRWLVFAGDLCDVFDHLGEKAARARMWDLFRQTSKLTWMILTKRPQQISKFLPPDWGEGYKNVWLGASVENRKNGYPRIDALRNVPASVRFLSCEPLLEGLADVDLAGIQWAIVGGESGPQARPFDINWALRLSSNARSSPPGFSLNNLAAVQWRTGLHLCSNSGSQLAKRISPECCLRTFPLIFAYSSGRSSVLSPTRAVACHPLIRKH